MRRKEGNKGKDIINAAIRTFSKFGFHESKISKIAELAKVSVGSIYVYYTDKEYILYKIFDNLWNEMLVNLREIYDRKNLDIICKYDAMIDMIFDAFTRDKNIAILIAHEQQRLLLRDRENFTPHYTGFIELGERIIRDGIKQKVFNPDINVKLFKLFLLGSLRESINNWASEPDKSSLNLIRKNIKSVTKYGLIKNSKTCKPGRKR
ncbi:MAG: TetR/AcrR family transcriptional regulator [Ignavibacteria bacterium]|nr:TetR/AcrR family transcriptional regulator [Ignavibacteria bacterium]